MMKSSRSFILFFLSLSNVFAFAPVSFLKSTTISESALVSSMAKLSPDELDDSGDLLTETSGEVEVKPPPGGEAFVPPRPQKKEGLTPIQKVFWLISDGVGYIFVAAGVALSFGLILNVMGYAYTLDSERGLEIDRIEIMRERAQFRAEVNRPPSFLPE